MFKYIQQNQKHFSLTLVEHFAEPTILHAQAKPAAKFSNRGTSLERKADRSPACARWWGGSPGCTPWGRRECLLQNPAHPRVPCWIRCVVLTSLVHPATAITGCARDDDEVHHRLRCHVRECVGTCCECVVWPLWLSPAAAVPLFRNTTSPLPAVSLLCKLYFEHTLCCSTNNFSFSHNSTPASLFPTRGTAVRQKHWLIRFAHVVSECYCRDSIGSRHGWAALPTSTRARALNRASCGRMRDLAEATPSYRWAG